MPSVLRNTKLFACALLRDLESVLQVIVCTALAVEGVNVESGSLILFDHESASTRMTRVVTSGFPKLLIMAKPSNENSV